MRQEKRTTPEQLALATYIKLMRATENVTSQGHRQLATAGLTVSQFGVLEALYHLGPLCQRDIGKKILKSSGNITTVIDNLEKRNLVVRQRDSQDRRYFRVELTGKGEELIAGTFPLVAKDIFSAFEVLSWEEQRQLGELCRKLGRSGAGHKPVD